jgi:integrase
MVKIDLGLYSIVMKYAHRPSSGKTIYYRRRIPKGLESHYDGKTFFVKSTGTTDAKLAAAILMRINTQAERDWGRLRQGLPMSVSEEMNDSVGQVLAPFGLNSLGRGSEVGKELFIESIFDQLPSSLKHEVVDNKLGGDQLHQAVESVLPPSLKIAYGRVNGRINLLASDYCEQYIEERGRSDDKKFCQGIRLSFQVLIDILGDQRPCEYYKPDVRTLIKGMETLGWKSATIKRRLQNIRAAFNKISDYHDIDDDKGHPFKNLDIPNEGEDAHERQDFSIAELHQIREKLKGDDTELALIIGIVMDTGVRVSECVGLMADDIVLDVDIPYLNIHRNSFRRLKTKNSTRFIPLAGGALDAAIIAVAKVKNKLMFPRYIDQAKGKVKNDVASNALNNRLSTLIDERKTMHSFRHTMQTRLRDVECPEDVRKELMGWQKDVSKNYGSPSDLKIKHRYLLESLAWERQGVSL